MRMNMPMSLSVSQLVFLNLALALILSLALALPLVSLLTGNWVRRGQYTLEHCRLSRLKWSTWRQHRHASRKLPSWGAHRGHRHEWLRFWLSFLMVEAPRRVASQLILGLGKIARDTFGCALADRWRSRCWHLGAVELRCGWRRFPPPGRSWAWGGEIWE